MNHTDRDTLPHYWKRSPQRLYGVIFKLEFHGERSSFKVITFISLLELARLKKLQVYQNEAMGTIYVEVKEDLSSFDVNTADGFEPEDEQNKPQSPAPVVANVEVAATLH